MDRVGSALVNQMDITTQAGFQNFLEKKKSNISSVKPLQSKNRDKIDLDAQNPNLKKSSDF